MQSVKITWAKPPADHSEQSDSDALALSYDPPEIHYYGSLRRVTAGEIDLGGDYPDEWS